MSDNEKSVSNNKVKVLTIVDFLSSENYYIDNEITDKAKLMIPVYQRPYRWNEEHVTALLSDLYDQSKRLGHYQGKPFNKDDAYRLGTVVLHKYQPETEGAQKELSLVDGQQRTLTLLLILLKTQETARFSEYLKNFVPVQIKLPDCSETQKNLSINAGVIERHVNSPEFTVDVLDFLLNHCEVVQVILDDLSEAFQFFDSQNARGLDLNPHDLLKAFHLREFPQQENDLKQGVVECWEQQNTSELKRLFALYLFPIRQWSRGLEALSFSKTNVDAFKGVNLFDANYPFQHVSKIVHTTVDAYNDHSHRLLDQQQMAYPFQLTQAMINGRRFFEWVSHYQALIKPLLHNQISINDQNWLQTVVHRQYLSQNDTSGKQSDRPTALTIIQVLNNQVDNYSYHGHWRKGDRYVRRMFNALVLCYYDRFGEEDLPRAIEYIFIWAYSLRLQKISVYLQSIEKHIRENNLFIRLQQSMSPVEFLKRPLPQLKKVEASNVVGLQELFRQLNYYQSEKKVTEGTVL